MGCNACRPSEPEALLRAGMALNKKEDKLKKINTHKKEEYNSFILLFENNLQYLGQYITEQDFNSLITEEIKNYMIENPLNINQDLYKELETFDVKPVEFKNGNIYFGNWNGNLKMEGLGKYYLKDDRVLAEGLWGNGDLIYSRVFLPNGDIYEGEMRNSTFNGKGKLTYANGDIYEGDFINGEKNGNGKIIFEDKTEYEGAFEKGEFKGNGKMKWINGNEYSGSFDGPKFCGFGVLSNSSCDIYEGIFDNKIDDDEGKKEYFNLQYNDDENLIQRSNMILKINDYQDLNLTEKTFLPVDKNTYILFPDFKKRAPKVLYFYKDRNHLEVNSYHSNLKLTKMVNPNNRIVSLGESLKELNFNMPSIKNKNIYLNDKLNPGNFDLEKSKLAPEYKHYIRIHLNNNNNNKNNYNIGKNDM